MHWIAVGLILLMPFVMLAVVACGAAGRADDRERQMRHRAGLPNDD